MEIRTLEFGSDDYERMIELRINTLLKPIGVPPAYIDPEKESSDIFIGAFENGRIVGCCVLTRKDRDTMQLRQMAVERAVQGKGVGAAIIEFAEELARDQHCKILMMHAREPVVGFYEKCGYHAEGAPFFEVGIGHRLMLKELT